MMGILHGKWILHISWIRETLESSTYVDELAHEVVVDSSGQMSGPILGRVNKGHKLLQGWEVRHRKQS